MLFPQEGSCFAIFKRKNESIVLFKQWGWGRDAFDRQYGREFVLVVPKRHEFNQDRGKTEESVHGGGTTKGVH